MLFQNIIETINNLIFIIFQGVQSQDRHLFLFNDLLLIAKSR